MQELDSSTSFLWSQSIFFIKAVQRTKYIIRRCSSSKEYGRMDCYILKKDKILSLHSKGILFNSIIELEEKRTGSGKKLDSWLNMQYYVMHSLRNTIQVLKLLQPFNNIERTQQPVSSKAEILIKKNRVIDFIKKIPILRQVGF